MKDFPEFSENSHEKLTKLDEEWMKSKDGKERWRVFIQAWVFFSTRFRPGIWRMVSLTLCA